LLFQDIAFIPMLALIPLLERPEVAVAENVAGSTVEESHAYLDLVSGLPNSIHAIVVLAAIATVVFGGHYLSRPLFRFVAMSRLREVFTAAALMLVIGIAALMSLVGLSPALGTFLAGVVLANSEFRHELESNIEPFKGLLLGLFFITVGAGINFEVLTSSWIMVGLLTLTVIIVKAAIIYSLVKSFGICRGDRWLVSLGLAQAGEFGFVLLSFSMQNHVIGGDIGELLALIIAISMFLTPVLFIFFDKVLVPRFERVPNSRAEDEISEQGKVIIAGIGRFGQIVNRLLVANDIQTVVLDHDAKQIDNLRSLKIKAYFGDATRPELLETAGVGDADMLVIAIDDRVRALELVKHMKNRHPRVAILVRAFDQIDYYRLKQAGAAYIIKETYASALDMGYEALVRLGFDVKHAEKSKRAFIDIENRNSDEMFESWRSSEGSGLSPGYRELFMQQEEALRKAMPNENKKADGTPGAGQ
ncbi:MAG: potassium transporter, partial [Gammaproteobacteria bacterium]|nr:potassium transporter [Gammaproteobacteria bacterium]